MKLNILTLSFLITGTIATSPTSLLIEHANKLKQQEQFDQAIATYKQVLDHEPQSTSALFNLGCSYLSIGKFDDAVDAFQQILDRSPHATAVRYNIAYTLKTAGHIDEAINLYKNIIADNPTYDPAHLALGFAYVTKGDFNNGWRQHERYLKQSGKNGDALRALLRSNTIAGKTILLRPEGGLGDTIMFIRYAQKLKEMGAIVITSVQRSLIQLLSRCPYIDLLLPTKSPKPPHDAQATLMSLPAIFNDNETTIPRNIPYIVPDPTLVAYWKEKLGHDDNRKIGICWQADVYNDSSRLPIARRGISLSQFFKLNNIPNISFYSLQKNDGVEQLENMPSNFSPHVFDDTFDVVHGSFMDTAAVMQHMDLIITVDTAIAHLAGALGRPVWLLLPFATDWRWIHERTDTPWYPTMRIFKQPTPFDWNSVMKNVYDALQNYH